MRIFAEVRKIVATYDNDSEHQYVIAWAYDENDDLHQNDAAPEPVVLTECGLDIIHGEYFLKYIEEE